MQIRPVGAELYANKQTDKQIWRS